VTLVTGGLRMIGAHTARALVDAGREVVAAAHYSHGVASLLDGRRSRPRPPTRRTDLARGSPKPTSTL
jgi:nucleoside-diphosphate-sugar epimerase